MSCQSECHVHDSAAGSWFLGLMLGLIGGTTIALLTAPRTGRETRQVLKESARDLPGKLGDLVDDSTQLYATGLSYLQTVAEEQTGRIRSAMAAGKLAAAKKREELELGNSSVYSFQHR